MNQETVVFPTLETERLLLRELADEDAFFIFKQFSDEDVCKYLYDEEPVSEVSGAREIIEWYKSPEGKDHNRWGIVNKSTNELMGTCGFHCWDRKNNVAEIGYDLGKEFWGNGFVTEAVRAAIGNAFTNMGLNRIQAFVAVDNERSCRLLERLGFTKEGVIRDKHLFRGKYYDHFCYSLLKSEWPLG